jgi:HSP20 family protein
MERIRQEFDDLFDRLFSNPFGLVAGDQGEHRFWDLDVSENDKELVVRAEVPGFDEKDLDVQMHNDVLTIHAEKRQEEKGERSFSSYTRSVQLPQGIDAEKAQATYRNGVLELHFPRPEGVRPRRIAVGNAGQAGNAPAAKETAQATAETPKTAASRKAGQGNGSNPAGSTVTPEKAGKA